MKFHTIISLVVVLLFAMSCKTKRLADGRKKPKKRSSAYLLKQLNAKKKTLDWFSAKAAIRYEDEAQRQSFSSYVRIRKDSVIWMNIKRLAVEWARVQITPDSIYILNRLDKEYTVRSFDFLMQQFKLPHKMKESLNFDALQNIFLGNPVFTPVKELEANVEAYNYQLSGEYDEVESSYQLDGDTYELREMKFDDQYDKKSLQFDYWDYQEVEKAFWMALKRQIRVNSETTGTIDLEVGFSKVEINMPKKIGFKVSKRYKRV